MKKAIETVSFLLKQGVLKKSEVQEAKSFEDLTGAIEKKKFRCSKSTCEAHWQQIVVTNTDSGNCRLCDSRLIPLMNNFNF